MSEFLELTPITELRMRTTEESVIVMRPFAWCRLSLAVILILSLATSCKRKATEKVSTHSQATPEIAAPAPSPAIDRVGRVEPSPAVKSTPFGRGPKLRHPERGIAGKPLQPDPLLNRLQQEFDGITENDPGFFVVLQRLWKEFSLPEFNRNLQSAADEQVKSGELLPLEFSAVMKRGEDLDDSLGLESKREQDAVRMLQALASLSGGAGGNHLPSLVGSRGDQLPPNVVDLIIFSAVRRGIQEMNPSTNRPYLELWQPLATARNPVYRLLALEAAQRAISTNARDISTEDRRFSVADAPAKVAFFRTFLAEKDPLILSEAVRAMGALPSSDAKAELEAFRDLQRRAGNESIALKAEAALRTCDALLAATERVR